jgi:hypothetical protein
MIPFWFWFLTATIGLGSIAISTYVVVFMKIAEIDADERSKAAERHARLLNEGKDPIAPAPS